MDEILLDDILNNRAKKEKIDLPDSLKKTIIATIKELPEEKKKKSWIKEAVTAAVLCFIFISGFLFTTSGIKERIGISGVSFHSGDHIIKKEIYSLEDILSVFKDSGVKLVKDEKGKLVINNEPGSFYKINNRADYVLGIYVYSSEKECEKGLKDFDSQTALVDFIYPITHYPMKNVMVTLLADSNAASINNQVMSAISILRNEPVYENFNVPDYIIVYKDGKESHISKDSELFYDILKFTDERFNKSMDIAKLAFRRDDIQTLQEKELTVYFGYSRSSTLKNHSSRVFSGLMFPLSGDYGDLCFFVDGGDSFTGPIGSLKTGTKFADFLRAQLENIEAEEKKPPELKLAIGGDSYYAIIGSCSWMSKKSDGTYEGIKANTALPPDLIKSSKPIKVTANSKIKLNFGTKPKDFEVYIWENGKSKLQKPDEDVITLPDKEGSIIYEIQANWELGKVVYAFQVIIESNAPNSGKLSLEIVKELSKKGDGLSWEDFKAYEGKDIGSGLYIMLYPIDDKYSISIGGGSKEGKPMYIRLTQKTSKGTDEGIDIRYEDVDKYINSLP